MGFSYTCCNCMVFTCCFKSSTILARFSSVTLPMGNVLLM